MSELVHLQWSRLLNVFVTPTVHGVKSIPSPSKTDNNFEPILCFLPTLAFHRHWGFFSVRWDCNSVLPASSQASLHLIRWILLTQRIAFRGIACAKGAVLTESLFIENLHINLTIIVHIDGFQLLQKLSS